MPRGFTYKCGLGGAPRGESSGREKRVCRNSSVKTQRASQGNRVRENHTDGRNLITRRHLEEIVVDTAELLREPDR